MAIDWFGRTAGTAPRPPDFEHMPHVAQTTWAGISADISAGVAELRAASGAKDGAVSTVGFCFGGRMAFVPQSYDWGQEAQVDWFEAVAKLEGEPCKLQFFAMRSMAS